MGQGSGLGRWPDVVVGFFEEHRNRFYNAALYASLGGISPGIKHVHRKIFLPTYGVFDEKRFVDSGHSVQAFDTPWGRAAMLVCEDAWHSLVPTIAAIDGAQILIVPSPSPARAPGPAGPRRRGGSAERPGRRRRSQAPSRPRARALAVVYLSAREYRGPVSGRELP